MSLLEEFGPGDVAIPLAAALAFGLMLGGVLFAGLWWTVRRGLTSRHPALWFGLGALGRLAAVFAGLYFVAHGGFWSLLACVFGMLIARVAVTHFTRPR